MEVLDISSNSNDTVIGPKNEEFKKEIPQVNKRDDDLDYLFNKYLGDKRKKTSDLECPQNITEAQSVGLYECKEDKYELDLDDTFPTNTHKSNSCDDGSLLCISDRKRLKTASIDNETKYSILDLEENAVGMSMECTKNTSKEQQKLERDRLRQEKLKMREQKKEEDQRNKAIKDALANHYRNLKPENCIKFIKVQIDETLANEDFSKHIIKELQQNGVSHGTIPHDISSIITWRTQLDTHILNVNGQLIDTSDGTKIDEVLLIMKWNDFLVHIHSKTFLSHVEKISIKLKGRKIILAIYGLGRYYQYQKRNKNQEFKEDISSKTTKDQRIYGNIPSISRRTVEYALTEIQLMYSISNRMVETEQDVASLVYQITKSIAQAPYKKRKQEEFIQSRSFMSEDNKNCIRVDKNGNGLLRLWKQIITIFPLASLETAEAIAAIYPTPSSLFKAYENVASTNEGENLLQDIPIRRAAGPISTMRKIGPELSRKMYNFFTSVDPDKLA